MSPANDPIFKRKAILIWQLSVKMRSIFFAKEEDKLDKIIATKCSEEESYYKIEHYIESDIILAILVYKILIEKSIVDNQKIKDFYFEILGDSIIDNIAKLSNIAFSQITILASTNKELILELNKNIERGRLLEKDKASDQEINLYKSSVWQLRNIEIYNLLSSITSDLTSFINDRLKVYSIELNSLLKNSTFPYIAGYFLYEKPLAITFDDNFDYWNTPKFFNAVKKVYSILEFEVPTICES